MKVVGNPPCKDCTKRQLGCHSTCKDYIEWNKAHLKEKARLQEKERLDNASISMDESISRKHTRAKENYRKGKR